jgi:ABC-type nitrate/sulfonate/bicarbonate transport system substrate-binding protein
MAFAPLKIIYRSKSHAPFWLVADKSGVWERNGLAAVNTSPQLIREKAAEALKNGDVDLISGNHHNLYLRNALGEDFVHLAQAANNWTENRLVAANRIGSVTDLKGKKVVVDKLTFGSERMVIFTPRGTQFGSRRYSSLSNGVGRQKSGGNAF